ncbi:MAG: hypothetical protein U1E76_28120 [Planctomycetota bacterium]
MHEILRQGNLHDVADLLMAPARSGIVLARPFLKRLALDLNLSGSAVVRKQFLENLFREAGRAECLPELFAALIAHARRAIDDYDRLGRRAAMLRRALKHHRAQAKLLARELAALRLEAERLRAHKRRTT